MRKRNKVTSKMKELMLKIKAQGHTIKDIAKVFKLSEATIRYHTDETFRQKQIANSMLNQKNGLPGQAEKRREYMRLYHARRYKNEPEFRDKIKKAVRECQKRKRDKNKEEKKGSERWEKD